MKGSLFAGGRRTWIPNGLCTSVEICELVTYLQHAHEAEERHVSYREGKGRFDLSTADGGACINDRGFALPRLFIADLSHMPLHLPIQTRLSRRSSDSVLSFAFSTSSTAVTLTQIFCEQNTAFLCATFTCAVLLVSLNHMPAKYSPHS